LRIVRILAAVIALLGLAAVSSATAAQAATLSGVVEGTRPEKEPERLSGVNVTVFKSGTEEKVAATLTSEFGKYAVEVPPGALYDVRFVPNGLSPFEPLFVPEVPVEESRELNVSLKYGGPAEEPEKDTQAPLLNEFGFEPEHVNVHTSAQTVQVFAEIGDNLSGVEKAQVVFRSPSGEVQTGASLERVSGSAKLGDYTGKVFVEKVSEAGFWQATVRLTDAAGNQRELGPEALKEAGFSSLLLVGNEAEEEKDTEAPKMTSFNFEPSEIGNGTSHFVHVKAFVTDNLAGFAKGAVAFRSPSGEVQRESKFELISGNSSAGTYATEVFFEKGLETGTWRPTVTLTDAAGNHRVIGPAQLKEEGFPSNLAIFAEETEEDTEAPNLLEFAFGPQEIDTTSGPQTVHAEAFITDDSSGVEEATVMFRSPSGEEINAVPFERFAGTPTAGTYETDAGFVQMSESGVWQVTVTLRDAAGNERVLGPAELEEAGFASQIVVIGAEPEEEEDTEAPTLKNFNFGPPEFGNGAPHAVNAKAFISDSPSGLAKARLIFRSPSGEVTNEGVFKRSTGNAQLGTYITEVPFEQFSEPGTWLASLVLADGAGNEREVSAKELKEDGFTSELHVFAEEEDVTAPELGEFGFSPHEIDVTSSAQKVHVGAFVSDEQSGVAKATVTFRSPNGKVQNTEPFELVSGNANAGSYVADVFFEQLSEAGTWLAFVRLVDEAGNERVIGPEELNVDGFASQLQVESSPPAPLVTGIEPSSGSEAGGTEVVISGENLKGATQVSFGSKAALEFSVNSPSSITAISPPGFGTVDVTVTTAGGSSETSAADHFTYRPPVTLTSTPNPSTHGEKVTLTATVTPLSEGAPAPLGTVSFVDGTSNLGVVNLKKGVATLKTSALGAGKHGIVAQYSGDANYPEAQSEVLTQIVDKAETELALLSSLNPAPFGSSGTLKATVKAIAPGTGTPAGTVTFSEGETVLATVQLSGANASLPLKSLAPGKHEITATYSGDANDKASQATIVQSIVKASTETSLTSTLNPAPYGSSATLKASVDAVAPGGGNPTGTVTFYEGEAVLAIVPLSSGTAKLALKPFTPGLHSIKATYNGDADYEASAGGIEQTITKASTELTLTSSKNPAPKGSSGTLKATVKALAPGGGTPNGSVTFSEGETVLAVIPLSTNSATYPLKSLAVGSHEITATYSGSGNYEASADSIVQVITP
jgi:hypothetical protein